MSDGETETPRPLPASERGLQRAQGVRHGLLELHKALVDAERVAYERVHGRVTAGEFLGVLVNSDEFAWLRPLTALIVQLDELIDQTGRADGNDANAWQSELATLLTPDASGSNFQRHYAELLQLNPDVALAHAAVARARRG